MSKKSKKYNVTVPAHSASLGYSIKVVQVCADSFDLGEDDGVLRLWEDERVVAAFRVWDNVEEVR